ncbi:hypothetical protein LEP1GSC083_1828 [Leptospira interrogans serovar Pyrogenes str. L0374]|uniref:Uncharacterized protein n=1 Tax=Leptospira interrogans serovar Pyrogenes str. L0374 TaxID=1049928 RepID=M6K7H0_LEPIR|nr:hypothetical protein LEP1GSC083_1828 [Leptospira interrogans serovar Pyrogenes str. L0374]
MRSTWRRGHRRTLKTKELTQSKIEEVSLEILLRHAVKAKHGLEKKV